MSTYKILIVDDLIDNLKIMVTIFEDHFKDCKIYQTSDSRNALDICKKTNPDIVVTDWKMPFISGIELTKQLKSEPKTQHVPVIITTAAMLSPEDLQVALESGATDFIIKPFNNIELLARTESAIKTARDFKKSIEFKDKELAENTIHLVKNKGFVSEIDKNLKELKKNVNSENIEAINLIEQMLQLTKSKISDDSLERFNIAFYSIHENFNKNLINKFPNLTKGEIKLCALLKLDMSTKDIASILFQSAESIKVSRSRLRKKLKLDQNQNLQVFLSSF